jgi:hypothetical protein
MWKWALGLLSLLLGVLVYALRSETLSCSCLTPEHSIRFSAEHHHHDDDSVHPRRRRRMADAPASESSHSDCSESGEQ